MRLYSMAIVAAVCLLPSQSLYAQASRDVLDDFQIAKSVGIGLTGVTTSTQLVVQDDFGVAYDTYSLLQQPSVRQSVGVSDEAFASIAETRAELVTEIESMVVSAVYSDEYRDKIRARFFDVEEEICSTLTDEQLKSLKFARVKVGVEKNGPKYLSNPHVAESLGIPETSAKQFAKSGDLQKQIRSRKKELLREANQNLIEFLSETEQATFHEVFDEKSQDDFLEADLIVDVKGKQHADLDSKRRSILKRRYVRRKLELTSGQIAKLEASDEASLDFLDQVQRTKVDRMVIVPEVKKRGTVVSLSAGFLSQLLSMDDERREELSEFGKELNERLENDAAKMTRKLLVKRFELTADKANEVAKLLSP